MFAARSIISLALALTAARASPINKLARRAPCASASGDAPYTVDCQTLQNAITCPNGIQGKAGGTVLLVHGTGSTGEESWANGPYIKLLPDRGPGFDVCWVTLPDRSLGDAQISAEYVAYAIPYLADRSATGKMSIIGHSQGAGLNPQWALTYWPSTRARVEDYVALAADFMGTTGGPLVCTAQTAAQGGCTPAIRQQSTGSQYLAAQNGGEGGMALVPTTSIYTVTDEIVMPQAPREQASANLPGSKLIAVQDLDVCGPAHPAEHFSMVIDPAAFNLAVDALTNTGTADTTRFDQLSCTFLIDNVLLQDFNTIPPTIEAIVRDVVAVAANEPRVSSEPALQQYVCDRGDASPEQCVPESSASGGMRRRQAAALKRSRKAERAVKAKRAEQVLAGTARSI